MATYYDELIYDFVEFFIMFDFECDPETLKLINNPYLWNIPEYPKNH